MNLIQKIAILAAVPIIFFSGCSKKPDYLIKEDNAIRIDYRKLSKCNFISRDDLEKELKDAYSGVGAVALFLGAERKRLDNKFSGAWEDTRYKTKLIGIFNEYQEGMDITSRLDPDNKKPECFPVVNIKEEPGKEICIVDIYADKEWINRFYGKSSLARDKIKPEKRYSGVYKMSLQEDYTEFSRGHNTISVNLFTQNGPKCLFYLSNQKSMLEDR
jgi:hypothetical protein